jgi:hypothetical protein
VKKQISNVSVYQTSKIIGIMYFAITLIFVPFGLILFLSGARGHGFGIFMIFAPLIYGIAGFIFAAFAGWLYNLVAQQWGGIEVTVKDA